jgi:oxygen-independent coproporphyrinogen-3 oxidase
MECNPATLTPEKLAGYKDAGVNRLSIGVQSLNDEVLEELGRLHTSEDVVKTFKMARKAKFDNISLDLMFSVPKQGIRDWRSVVKRTAGLKPEHMSIYSLEIAENTEFGRRLKNHEMEEQIFSVDRTMYRIALEALRKRGLYRYEISNVARPGKECRHNLKYWSLEDYLALGAGSHGYIKGVRYSNVSNIENYISMMKNQDLFNLNKLGESEAYCADCVDYYHINSFMDNVSEYTFTALRTRGGVEFKRFEELFNRSFWDVYSNEREEFDSYVRSGLAVSDDEHIALTLDGIDISNRIMAIFV